MKLYEHQAHDILGKFGVPSPEGAVAFDVETAVDLFRKLESPAVLKAQVLTGGRGKAGGIQLARTADEAENAARELLSMSIRGIPVKGVFVQKAVNILREMFLSFTLDRTARCPVAIVSAVGGVDIEEFAREHPCDVRRIPIDPLVGMESFKSRAIARTLHPEGDIPTLQDFVEKLYSAFIGLSALLVEVNPLALDTEGNYIALDAKMIIDESAIGRQAGLFAIAEEDSDRIFATAKSAGISYIPLDGEVGCIVNGAGLAMATMDTILAFGAKPANFLDIGGSSSVRKMEIALELLLEIPQLKAIAINIFGGITRCDEIAEGIRNALSERHVDIPIFARMIGTNSEIANNILDECQILRFDTMDDLIRASAEAVRE